MIRRLAVAFLFISCSWCQDVTAPSANNTPINVKIEMPPQNVWIHFAEVLLPGLIGGLIALLSVWSTNRTNKATNEATRAAQMDIEKIRAKTAVEAKTRDNRWEFRKDIYYQLIEAVTGLINVYSYKMNCHKESASGKALSDLVQTTIRESEKEHKRLLKHFTTYANLASLAVAEDVFPAVTKAAHDLDFTDSIYGTDSKYELGRLTEQMKVFQELLHKLKASGRKDLWEGL